MNDFPQLTATNTEESDRPAEIRRLDIAVVAGVLVVASTPGDLHVADSRGVLMLPAAARRLGVATDSVSGSVLAWQLRPPGANPWSRMMRDRADLGLITPLTLHELDRAGSVQFTAPGQKVSVCENPQVLQAAAHARTESPLLCLSGNPASVGTQLLRSLIAEGNPVRYHGDFDWPGVAIAGRIIARGAAPWHISAPDYRAAVVGGG